MTRARDLPRYIIVSPVKDEQRYVVRTLDSVINQTIKPLLWVLVDDGSTDRTLDIISHYETQHDFIRVISRPAGGPRQPGSQVITAFNVGYASVPNVEHDFVVKLDCDLSFEADYFEKLLDRFTADHRLGIASGVYLESPDGVNWTEVSMPAYHAAGASKVVRRECFTAIGGFVACRGWDTLDEIRSLALGWRTAHFRDLAMRHWKTEGSGIGQWRTNLMHGEIYYRTGGSLVFFLLKFLYRMTRPPYVLGAIALLLGYLECAIKRKPLLVTDKEGQRYRAVLNGRLFSALRLRRALTEA